MRQAQSQTHYTRYLPTLYGSDERSSPATRCKARASPETGFPDLQQSLEEHGPTIVKQFNDCSIVSNVQRQAVTIKVD
jgi:hypothetical protein